MENHIFSWETLGNQPMVSFPLPSQMTKVYCLQLTINVIVKRMGWQATIAVKEVLVGGRSKKKTGALVMGSYRSYMGATYRLKQGYSQL